jgi:hypothetical protein
VLPVATQPGPDYSTVFLSLTITSSEPISIFLEQRLLHLTRQSSPDDEPEDIGLFSSLLGAKSDEDVLIPITLDLRTMPMEMSGIVCGVAGTLATGGGQNGDKSLGSLSPEPDAQGPLDDSVHAADAGIDVTFLSTAKAGTVLVRAAEVDAAVAALERGMREVKKDDGQEFDLA